MIYKGVDVHPVCSNFSIRFCSITNSYSVTMSPSQNQAQPSKAAFGCFKLVQIKDRICRNRAKFTPQRRKEVTSLRGNHASDAGC
jgi:hypothetical protein